MAVKALMPNQCVPLHFLYGPEDCCLCSAKQELALLQLKFPQLESDYKSLKDDYDKIIREGLVCPLPHALDESLVPEFPNRREMIRSAAVRKNGTIYVCFAHTYPELKRMNLDAPDDVLKHSEQGFVTSTGRFVDRKEALLIAQAASQIKYKHGSPDEILYSEDLR